MELDDYRKGIDQIDSQLLKLFQERMDLSEKIGSYKKKAGLPVLNPAREREILHQVTENAGVYGVYARVLFETLFDLSRSYQNVSQSGMESLSQAIDRALEETPKVMPRTASVACQGVEGAYSQQAATRLFPQGTISYVKNFEGVFAAVEKGLCEYGVLPIENSIHGTVNEVYDLMRHHDFHIVRSIRLQINHVLLARPGTALSEVREVYSHPQALGQCSAFLQAHPDIRVHVCENTAMAAQEVARSERRDIAAIGSGACASLYNLRILQDRIQNSDYNFTRFICIAKKMQIFPGADRISLMVAVPHQPGALYRLMSNFAALGVNLLKLESRPIPGRDFEFLFYFDFEASVYQREIVTLLGRLAARPETFVLLGCYREMQ